MRIVLVALGLVVLLGVGWVLKGLMTDRDERDFAVHYSWIVKWALTLSRETQRAPASATFDSPRIEVAGHPNRWVVSGHVNWRDALGEPVGEPYAAVVENICKAYADPDCWTLEGFAIGEPAIELAETTLGAGPVESTGAEPLAGSTPAPEQQPKLDEATSDPVLALLEVSTPSVSEGAVPDAPAPPIAQGIALPERKPAEPVGIADVEFLIAETIRMADADSLAAIEEASRPSVSEADTLLALTDTGAIVTEVDSAAALEVLTSPPGAENGQLATEQSPVEEEEMLAELPPAAPFPANEIRAEIDQSLSNPEPVDPEPEAAPPLPVPQSSAIETASTPLPPATVQPDADWPDTSTEESSQFATPPFSTAPAALLAPDSALIVLIQDRLDRAGYDPGPIDGLFGERTRAALQGFERDTGLPVTGQPSQGTLAVLERFLATRTATQPAPPRVASFPADAADPGALSVPAGPSAPTVLAPAPAAPSAAPARASAEPTDLIQPQQSRSPPTAADESLIFLIQHRLKQAGFTPGRFDGRMSQDTANAIRAYQSEKGLTVNGVPSRALLEQLEADVLDGSRSQPLAPTPLGFVPCHTGVGPGCVTAAA
ncbi:MAG TPA: peptidoglycan-binding protein [Alphaproteobacteria bacterium]|nr:peptidoglycan-binding protein [Alphaproteobacteria bacterium]